MADIVLYAHRGSNPYPDHSLQAYTWAVNWGADVIEPDLYLTKDGVLVSSHDNHNYSNLTYAEAKAIEPALLTFGEVIELAKAMSIETGRDIGIVPETKSTDYATSEAVIKELIAHGFTDPDRVVIQSFASGNLQQLHNTIMPQYGVDIPLAFLGSGITNPASIATFADIVAPSFGSFSATDVAAAHAAGLKVVAWTILGSQADIQSLINMGVDAVFVDDMHLARPAAELIDGVNVVYGTPQWDVVNGTVGADKVYAMQGDDIVRAGDGDDVLYGDGGNDLLFGGTGNDQLVGGAGTDYLAGGEGSDVLDGSAGNDVIVATGDEVVFRAGSGIDLVSLDATSTVRFDGVTPASVTVLRDGNNLIIRSGSDVLVLLNGVDPAHQPASITTADGFSLTGAELAAMAAEGTDAEVSALLPGLEDVLAHAPAFAAPSTVAVGTDLVAEGDFGNGVLSQHIEAAETGAVYRLSFSLADLPAGDDGVRVLWNGQVVYEGTPAAAGSDLHFLVTGGSGDGSNELVFEGAGSTFGATLDDVHLVKITDPALPSPGNVAPVAEEANILVSKDIAFSGKVVATDANNDVLAYSLGEAPAHGTLVFNANGSYRYTPAAGFTGADGFTFLVSDGHGGLVETAVNLTVVPGIAIGTDLVVNGSFEDVSLSTGNNGAGDWGYRNAEGVIAGWTEVNHVRLEQHWDAPNGVVAKDGQIWIDMDGYNTNTHLVQQVAHVETGATYELSFSLGDADTAVSDDGIRVMFGGRVVYEGIPTNPWQTFTFRVTGGAGDGSNKLEFIATGTNLNTYGAALDDVRFVKVAEAGDVPANTVPDALDAAATGMAGTVIAGQLVASDADNDVLSFALGEGPAHGTVVVNANGSYSYTPAANYAGTDSFTYTVNDGHGGVDTATVKLTVALRAGEVAIIGPNLIVNGGFEDLTGADDAGTWGYRNTSPAGVIPGWVNEGDNRAEVHRDTVGGVGPAEGSYWFDMEGAPKNAKLVQTVAGIEQGATYQLKFSIADTDTAQTNDSVSVYWGGQLIYTGTPLARWQEITVDVVGGAGDGSNKLIFQSTTPSPNGAGVALDKVSLYEIDAKPNLIVNGSFEDLTGADNAGTWGYRNTDGTVPGWIDISGQKKIEQHGPRSMDAVNNPIDAADGNYYIDLVGSSAGANSWLAQNVAGVEEGRLYELTFSLADGDKARANNGVNVYWGGELVYSTSPGWDPATGTIAAGAAAGDPMAAAGETYQTITVRVVGGDGNGSNQLSFQGVGNSGGNNGPMLDDISLRLVNAAPVVQPVTAGTDEDTAVTGTIVASDVDGDTLVFAIKENAGPAHGVVTLDAATGAWSHTPDADYNGADSFTVVVSDGQGGTAETTVSLTVKPVNDAPVAVDDGSLTTGYGAALTVAAATLLLNDSDVETAILAILSVQDAVGGTVALENGNVVFTPAQGFAGNASFTYTVSDGQGGTATASARVTVAAPAGTDGDDAFTATPGNDTILAGLGDDEISGGAGNDVIDGGAGDDTLSGDDGNDVLKGGGGDDALSGGAGSDILVGGAGDDDLDGGEGVDTADYSGDSAGIVVDLAAGTAEGDAIGADTLRAIETVIGGVGRDLISGDHLANLIDGGAGDDVLNGGAGDDIILAGLGDDVIDGGAGFDTLDLSGATGPVSVDFAHGTVSGEGIGSDSFSGIEKLLFGAGDDVVAGGNGNEAFDGGAGNDILKGGAGNDSLAGGEGDDSLDGGSGDDVVHGGNGIDTIKAGSGSDMIDAGAGNDVIDGGSGNDIILAGAGNDSVDAGSGDDRIAGGAGDDVLAGGSGHDVFVFAAGFGKDTITDFKTNGANSDVLEFSVDVFADATAALAAAHQDGADVVFTIDADTSLTLKNVQLASLHDFHFA